MARPKLKSPRPPSKRGGARPNSGKYHADFTEGSLDNRNKTWVVLRKALQKHLFQHPWGEASRIARFVGTTESQIHRYSCPVCEHDQEPRFSTGMAILLYLEKNNSPLFTMIQNKLIKIV